MTLIALLQEVISEGINKPLHQNSMKELMFSILLNDSDVKWSKELNHIDTIEEYLNNLVGHDLNHDNKVDEYDYALYLSSRVQEMT